MTVGTLAYVRSLRSELPRSVYVLQAGLVLNAFGNGAANPFVVLYLHDVRGVPLGVAGLAAAANATAALASALIAGRFADRSGARATMIVGLGCSATAFVLYPFVNEPWQAFPVAMLGGAGGGIWLTMQSALLATITPKHLRAPAFAQQRVVANVGLGLGGFVGGLIVTTGNSATFTTLFLFNAVTFVVYSLFLLSVHVPARKPAARHERGGYGAVLRDGAFVRFAAVHLVYVTGTIALLNGLFPVYAHNEAAVSEHTIGAFFLLNSLLIIVFQIPTTRACEGRSRMRGFALIGVLFAACWLLVFAGGSSPGGTVAILLLAAGITAMSFGECIYDSIQGPLVSDLAPAQLLGRYMAVMGFAWQLGFIAGPATGGFILGANPSALWPTMAAICLVGAAYSLRLERRLPETVRVTPRRERATVVASTIAADGDVGAAGIPPAA
ncbi:MAG: MFS transporter [Gaiellaceae bacterium]